jgi:hypothetical protein
VPVTAARPAAEGKREGEQGYECVAEGAGSAWMHPAEPTRNGRRNKRNAPRTREGRHPAAPLVSSFGFQAA